MAEADALVYDPTDISIQDQEKLLSGAELSLNELIRKPDAVRVVLQNQRVQLYELRGVKDELKRAVVESSALREDREKLRIENARLLERASTSFIDIPVGIMTGFAVNMLTANPGDRMGWVLLVTSSLILVVRRQSDLGALITTIGKSWQRGNHE